MEGMTIGDLVYSLGAQWDEASLKDIEDGFTNISKSFMTAVGVASAAMAGTFAVVKDFAEVNDELGKMARNRDIAVDSLQALQYSFKSAGLEGSKVGDVLAKLQEQKEGFRTGKADFEAFDRIGINPNTYKDTESYFNAVIDGLNGIEDEASKADLAKRLLGSSDMKNLIDGGSEAIKKQKQELEELGILVTNQDLTESTKFNNTLLYTMTILKGLANKVMTSIMPIFTKLMEQYNSFIKANKELISSGLKSFLDGVINGSKFFLSLIGRIIEHLSGLQNVITVIAGLLLIWQLPLVSSIAAVVGIMVAFDDLMNFIEGKDSAIAGWLGVEDIEDFKNQFPIVTSMIHYLVDILQMAVDGWKLVFSEGGAALEGIGILIDKWIVTPIQEALGYINDLLSSFSDIKENISSFIPDIPSFNDMTNAASSFIPDIPSFNDMTNAASSFMGFPTQMTPQPVYAQASPSTQMVDSSKTTTNTYNITASVDAKSKSINQALIEISTPAGYN